MLFYASILLHSYTNRVREICWKYWFKKSKNIIEKWLYLMILHQENDLVSNSGTGRPNEHETPSDDWRKSRCPIKSRHRIPCMLGQNIINTRRRVCGMLCGFMANFYRRWNGRARVKGIGSIKGGNHPNNNVDLSIGTTSFLLFDWLFRFSPNFVWTFVIGRCFIPSMGHSEQKIRQCMYCEG